jgi:hypothetical protein
MPITGIEKDRLNFVDERVRTQKAIWPGIVEKWDAEANGKRYKSEVLSMKALWNLYVGGNPEQLTEEEEARGKKPLKKKTGYEVIPIKAFELPGRFNEKGRKRDDTLIHTGVNGYLHFNQWLMARDQARKDLFWFGKEVFHMDFEPEVHQVTCNQFVQKDFDGVWVEDYGQKEFKVAMASQTRIPRVWVQADEYEKNSLRDIGYYMPDPIEAEKGPNLARTMILLDPRGFFKSYTDALDCVQWIINCPDIRILIMSGTYKLTLQFLANAKGKFYLPRGLRPTYFHLLFPEYVIRGVDGDSKEPLILDPTLRRLESQDPTLGIMSIGSSLSGFHCDVLKFDDIVTDENCNTDETREGLKDKADGAVNLRMPWGWTDIIGTRYFPDDYYGLLLDKFKESPEDFNLKFFTRAAWVVKPEFKDVEERSLFELKEDMVDLTFPQHKSWKSLRQDLKNEKSFRCQQLNQPVWGNENSVKFDRGVLEAHRGVKLLAEVVMAPGKVYGAIDLARENKQFSDFTALAVGKVYQEGSIPILTPEQAAASVRLEGKWILVVLDVQFGKWSQTEIAARIAKMHDVWRPSQWYGEDTGGIQLLKEKIVDVSKTTYGHWPYIDWRTPDNSENAKRGRIKGLEMLLTTDRLFFLTGGWNSEVFEQLEKYKGQKSTRFFKDDVPDVLSQLANKYIPSIIQKSKKELIEEASQREAQYREYLRREVKRQIYGEDNGGFGMAAPSQSYWYNEPPPQQPSSPVSEIARKLFGGNGMRG